MKAEERETLADHLTLCSTRGARFPSKDQGSAPLTGLALDDRARYAGSTMEALYIVKLTNEVKGECDLNIDDRLLARAELISMCVCVYVCMCVCLYVCGDHCLCVCEI